MTETNTEAAKKCFIPYHEDEREVGFIKKGQTEDEPLCIMYDKEENIFYVYQEKLIPGCHTLPNGDPGYPDVVDFQELSGITHHSFERAWIELITFAPCPCPKPDVYAEIQDLY